MYDHSHVSRVINVNKLFHFYWNYLSAGGGIRILFLRLGPKVRSQVTSVEDLPAPEVEELPGTVPLLQGRWKLRGRDVQVDGHQRDADQTHMNPPLSHLELSSAPERHKTVSMEGPPGWILTRLFVTVHSVPTGWDRMVIRDRPYLPAYLHCGHNLKTIIQTHQVSLKKVAIRRKASNGQHTGARKKNSSHSPVSWVI